MPYRTGPRGGCSRGAAVLGLLYLATIAVPASAPAASVVKVLASPNPVVVGQNVTLSAGVTYTASVPASGTITITDTVTCPGATSATMVALGTITLGSLTSPTPGAGTLVVSSSSLPCVGQNSLVASYPGDSNYLAGTSQPLLVTVLAQFTPTTTDLTATPNPSAAGQAVTFTSRVRSTQAGAVFPTGIVVFTDTNTNTVLGTARVQTSGGGVGGNSNTAASITTSSLAAGSYAVQAAYSGDNIYSPSSSQIVVEVVGPGTPPAPSIATVVTTQGGDLSQNTNIAQNTWIEIHGSNLAQTTEDWSKQDFSKGLPMSLGGVSATVNSKPAAISYVSPTQVNILTPIDNSVGPVPVQLTTPNGTAPVATAMEAPVSPSFLVLDGAGHVAARHADFSPAGPASLSAPGFTFTPAKPGEIVLLYAVGLGQTSPPISDQQGSGSLPNLPAVMIGGVPATVQAAGISGPGLYQFNVLVPSGAPDGDLMLSGIYNGISTETGVVLTVQH
jgi:uncharacterized protein (TIGR03437 family)